MRLFVCRSLIFSVTASLFFLSCSKDEDKEPTHVQEDLYINEIYASGDDWIELFNKTATTKDISGYTIYDDPANKYTLPSGTVVPASGFLVIFCDDLNTGLHTNFKLTSTGEKLTLANKGGAIVDEVTFPSLSNNQSYGRFPDGLGILAISGNPSQGEANGNSSAPSIVDVVRSPLVVRPDNPVTVTATLLSMAGVSSVKLFYSINGGTFTSLDMTAGAGSYSAVIPALNAEGRIDYYVEASSNTGASSTSPASAPDNTRQYILSSATLPNLVINEYMAFNTSCCPDNSSGAEEFDDWIEIYNAGSEAVDVGGMYLSDDPANPFGSKIPATNSSLTTIQPGGYLLFWADGNKDQGELHLNFGLNAEGESVGLYFKDGRTIDEHAFGAQVENKSEGRSPNGTGNFQLLNTPTPGLSN
jgi:hypothetical protein